jgi:hypothetical protein
MRLCAAFTKQTSARKPEGIGVVLLRQSTPYCSKTMRLIKKWTQRGHLCTPAWDTCSNHYIDRQVDVAPPKRYNELQQAPSIATRSQDISHKLVQDADPLTGSETEANRGRNSVLFHLFNIIIRAV